MSEGINREPEKHLGALGVRHLNTHDISVLLERRAAEGEQERAQREDSIIDLSGDLKRAKAERTDPQEAARALAAQAMKAFKQEQAARTIAAQAMEKFKAEQERKAKEQRQESKLSSVDKESKPERGR